MGYLKGATESMTSDAVLQWLVSCQQGAQSYPLSFPGLAYLLPKPLPSVLA